MEPPQKATSVVSYPYLVESVSAHLDAGAVAAQDLLSGVLYRPVVPVDVAMVVVVVVMVVGGGGGGGEVSL